MRIKNQTIVLLCIGVIIVCIIASALGQIFFDNWSKNYEGLPFIQESDRSFWLIKALIVIKLIGYVAFMAIIGVYVWAFLRRVGSNNL